MQAMVMCIDHLLKFEDLQILQKVGRATHPDYFILFIPPASILLRLQGLKEFKINCFKVI